MRAMILAAGLGTRLGALTSKIPKALIQINNTTLLELLIGKLKSFGYDRIIINVHHFAEQIIDYLHQKNYFDLDITLSDENDKLLDTGGGLKKASWFFNDEESFLVHNVDVLSDLNLNDLKNFHTKSEAAATLVVKKRMSNRHLLFDESNILCGWENCSSGEKKIVRKSGDNLFQFAFSGIQFITPKIFNYFPDDERFSLIDLYLNAASNEKICALVDDKNKWLDVGKPENLEKAKKFFNY